MKINLSVIGVIIVLGLILGSFYLGRNSTQSERDRLNMAIADAKKQVLEDSVVIAGLKYKTFTQDAYIVSSERTLKQFADENAKLKALKVKNIQLIALLNAKVSALERQGEYVPAVIRDTVQLWEEDNAPIEPFKSAVYKDQWMTASVELKNKPIFNVVMDSIPLQITIADKKMGLFKKSPTVSIVDTPNPYVNIDKNDVLLVQKPKRFYETKLFAILGAVGVTYLIVR